MFVFLFCSFVCLFWFFTTNYIKGLAYGFQPHFQQYFSYIVAVSFIGGGNRSTRRKHPTSHYKTLSHYVVSSTPPHERDSNSQR